MRIGCGGLAVRLIYGDTETTGLSAKSGDKLCEIGFKEFVDFRPTGRVYHQYVNPLRDMPEGAFKVHGLSNEFLDRHPPFPKVVDAMLTFVAGAKLVFHNKSFDLEFLLAEIRAARREPNWDEVIDTLAIANKRFPGQPNNLDALCSRFKVTGFDRSKHGTMVDIDMLAEVHAHLSGKRTLALDVPGGDARTAAIAGMRTWGPRREGGAFDPGEEGRAAHLEYMRKNLKKGAWLDIHAATTQAAG